MDKRQSIILLALGFVLALAIFFLDDWNYIILSSQLRASFNVLVLLPDQRFTADPKFPVLQAFQKKKPVSRLAWTPAWC